MAFDCAQERTWRVASGATTRILAPASKRLEIFASAMLPAPTTRHGRDASFRNIGKSFSEFMRSRAAPCCCLQSKPKAFRISNCTEGRGDKAEEFGLKRDGRE